LTIPAAVLRLVERFSENRDAYQSGAYNETQLRREFLDPFFEALGWDVSNKQGNAEAYKDVVHEDAIKVGGFTKAPDYSFRIGGTRKFFVEAKKPSVDIKGDPSSAFQLRRYAWSAKLPLSILTDFEEFAVYDCRLRPSPSDKAPVGRLLYFRFDEYAQRWDEIASVFSREAVLRGSFDKYAETKRGKRGTATVDDAFLEEMDGWRKALARTIALRNAKLSVEDLNFSVQRIIDRLIFLRICEDRGIEDYGRLQALQNGANIYDRLVELFHHADDRYDSGIFGFRQERGRQEPPDTITPRLHVDDEPLKQVIRDLYYPHSPYEFSVLPADILGQVYERFLGKVIRLTAGHRAVVEPKPEVRKAGGVFYTPTYVVDYIVEQTVGKFLPASTPKKAAGLRILDPACGSGSFLIAAYQRLLDWHRDHYVASGPGRHKKELYQGGAGEWRLTTAEKKRILLNNIFGVDIDPQAVEVTKLSLLLKVLEGESEETLRRQFWLLRERALPDLGRNIKCGNSIIETDISSPEQLSILQADPISQLSAFDWATEFAAVFAAGGFDIIIGNPPYIPIESMSPAERTYFQVRFPQLQRKFDSAAVFILRMVDLLNADGLLSFISSLTWQTGENFASLREHIVTRYGVLALVHLPFNVFRDAYVDTGIYVIGRRRVPSYGIHRFPKSAPVQSLSGLTLDRIPTRLIRGPAYRFVLDVQAQGILDRALRAPGFTKLGDISDSTQGLAAGRYVRHRSPGPGLLPFLESGQVHRYCVETEQVTYTDLRKHASLERFYSDGWKLLVRRVVSRGDRLIVAATNRPMVFKKDINPFVLRPDVGDPFFFLAILNSRLISYLYVNTSAIATKDDFRQTTLAELRGLPIPRYSAKSKEHVELARYARTLSEVAHKARASRREADRLVAAKRERILDARIDELVYRIYSIPQDEIEALSKSGDDLA
jgi:hypothetical protein